MDQLFNWERRYNDVDRVFHNGIQQILELNIDRQDFIHQFPLFTGHVNLGRYLALYESYKMVQNLHGQYADIGTWEGASFLFVAKLIKLFEPHAFSQVHAFDWFQGMHPAEDENDRSYAGNYHRLLKLVEIQDLSDIALVHKLDLTRDLDGFFKDPKHEEMRFKYVFMDCGIREVLEQCIPFFWHRLVQGGIMLFDHYGIGIGSESSVVDRLIADQKIRCFPFCRQPTAYIIKEG